ncbi:putative jmjc domain-containing protein [Acanthamoeba polyphaga mimivirus]|uniref:Putative jmjc domain-containing protein n=1 Tax=Acanthamoeba polyphaga mimivirus TaxID=212035 RepID=A0A0G2YAF0_MIMIV|nr:putative jmjc domain-containing protein [Acanthamoeba polyphaga mimivirus]
MNNMKKIIIISIIIIIIIVLLFYINKSLTNSTKQSLNKIHTDNYDRHVYSNGKYAHFSKITRDDSQLYPSLKYCTKYEFELRSGDMLYIPKGWWHWIESIGRTISVNFWWDNGQIRIPNNKLNLIQPKTRGVNCNKSMVFETNYINNNNSLNNITNPIIIRNGYSSLKEKFTDKFLLDKIPKVEVWDGVNNTVENTTLKKFINSKDKHKYIITLDQFSINNHIKNILKNDVIVPTILSYTNCEYNFWFSYNYMDTGLHYDDYDGLLCVIDGIKKIKLYAPCDSPYLHSFPLFPKWSTILPPTNISYNLYKNIEWMTKPSNNSLPSSMLLFKTVHNKYLITIIDKLYNIYGSNNIIYGIKNSDGKLRWEFYFYRTDTVPGQINILDKNNPESWIPKFSKILQLHMNNVSINKPINKNNLLVSCFDYQPELFPKTDIDLYYSIPNNFKNLSELNSSDLYKIIQTTPETEISSNYPLFIAIYNHNTNLHKGNQIIDFKSSVIKNLDEYLFIFNIPQCKNWIGKTLNYYGSNKNIVCSIAVKKDTVGLFWFGLTTQEFIKFLNENQWNSEYVNWLSTNSKLFDHLSHEICIHYDYNGNPKRSAFYGII